MRLAEMLVLAPPIRLFTCVHRGHQQPPPCLALLSLPVAPPAEMDTHAQLWQEGWCLHLSFLSD